MHAVGSEGFRTPLVLDDRTLLAFGWRNGTIAGSADAGATWVNVRAAVAGEGLWNPVDLGRGVLVAVGERGAILRSENAGASWLTIRKPTGVRLSPPTRIGESSLIILGDLGVVLRSSDAGLNWKELEEMSKELGQVSP